MDQTWTRKQCDNAKFPLLLESEQNFSITSLAFRPDARRPDGSGAGNIRPKKSSVVYGALYTLEEGGLDKLDVFQLVKEGCFRRQNVTVETLDGQTVEAATYVVTESFYQEGLLPRRDYLNHCLTCKDVVPADYYAFFESFKEICQD